MGRDGKVSNMNEKAFIKGEIVTVKEVHERFSLAITLNNIEIVEILFNTDRPLTNNDIQRRVEEKYKTPTQQINSFTKKLFDDKLLVKVRAERGRNAYLLSEKGYHKYKKAVKVLEERSKN